MRPPRVLREGLLAQIVFDADDHLGIRSALVEQSPNHVGLGRQELVKERDRGSSGFNVPVQDIGITTGDVETVFVHEVLPDAPEIIVCGCVID